VIAIISLMMRLFMYRISIILSLLALSHTLAAQTVLVTGSNRGIGLEFVSQYAERDWDVIATSRSPMDDYDLQALAKKYKNIQIETLDVTDQHEIEALVAKLEKRPIDLLINNAGLLGDRSKQQWGEINKETFDQLMDVNVFGPLKVSEAFSKNVIASEKKQIIVLSSIIGSIGMRNSPTPLPSLAISKAAVNMAMKTVATQLESDGVHVAMLFPGSVQTRMMHQAFGMDIEEASNKKDFDYGFESLTPSESVTKMISVIDKLDRSKTGLFLNNDGTEIPW
tara:strand:+ start:170 stop:1012 length:843 start_codon:yes stop_codon:yes gene_type:complete